MDGVGVGLDGVFGVGLGGKVRGLHERYNDLCVFGQDVSPKMWLTVRPRMRRDHLGNSRRGRASIPVLARTDDAHPSIESVSVPVDVGSPSLVT